MRLACRVEVSLSRKSLGLWRSGAPRPFRKDGDAPFQAAPREMSPGFVLAAVFDLAETLGMPAGNWFGKWKRGWSDSRRVPSVRWTALTELRVGLCLPKSDMATSRSSGFRWFP